MNVIQVQNEPAGAACPNCGAEVTLDQRYCLSCGQPCSPVRLAFLDVLQAESAQRAPAPLLAAPNGYLPAAMPDPLAGRLSRFSGLLGLLAALLLMGIAGLLIGHWIGGGGSSGPRVIKVVGLGGVAAPATGSAASEGTATAEDEEEKVRRAPGGTGAKRKGGAEQKEEAASEAQETKAAKLPEPVKPSSTAQEKLSKLSGKQYEQEIEKVVKGPQPIETG